MVLRQVRTRRDLFVAEPTAEEAEAFVRDLESLGPTFIKLGQLLSTRADLLPRPYLDALARLLLFIAAAGSGFWMAWTILAGDVRTRHH